MCQETRECRAPARKRGVWRHRSVLLKWPGRRPPLRSTTPHSPAAKFPPPALTDSSLAAPGSPLLHDIAPRPCYSCRVILMGHPLFPPSPRIHSCSNASSMLGSTHLPPAVQATSGCCCCGCGCACCGGRGGARGARGCCRGGTPDGGGLRGREGSIEHRPREACGTAPRWWSGYFVWVGISGEGDNLAEESIFAVGGTSKDPTPSGHGDGRSSARGELIAGAAKC